METNQKQTRRLSRRPITGSLDVPIMGGRDGERPWLITTTKGAEARCRRIASRQGLTLKKSRRRDPRAADFGHYFILDWHGVLAFPGGDDTGATLEECAGFLDTPQTERPSYGPGVDLVAFEYATGLEAVYLTPNGVKVWAHAGETGNLNEVMEVIEAGAERAGHPDPCFSRDWVAHIPLDVVAGVVALHREHETDYRRQAEDRLHAFAEGRPPVPGEVERITAASEQSAHPLSGAMKVAEAAGLSEEDGWAACARIDLKVLDFIRKHREEYAVEQITEDTGFSENVIIDSSMRLARFDLIDVETGLATVIA